MSIVLKSTIDEWKERNEAKRIKVARATLSLAYPKNMVFEVREEVHDICEMNPYNKVHVCSAGILLLLVKTLEYKSQDLNVHF